MHERGLSRSRLGSGQRRAPEGRRVLDLAEGILIGLRRYSAEAAFGELVAVAHRHDITVSAAASALVELATGGNDPADFHRVVVAIAQHEWGSMLLARAGSDERQVRR